MPITGIKIKDLWKCGPYAIPSRRIQTWSAILQVGWAKFVCASYIWPWAGKIIMDYTKRESCWAFLGPAQAVRDIHSQTTLWAPRNPIQHPRVGVEPTQVWQGWLLAMLVATTRLNSESIWRMCRQPSFPRWGWVPGVMVLTSLRPQSGRDTPCWAVINTISPLF